MTVLSPVEAPPWAERDPMPAYAVDLDGRRLGVVYQTRHVVRETYGYTRIGYDRTHTCWRADPATAGVVRGCWPTRKGAVAALAAALSRAS